MEYRVQIAQDRTKAFLTVAPAEHETSDTPLKLEELAAALNQAGVVHGIKNETLQEIVDNFLVSNSQEVAECTPPTQGKDARVEILVKPQKREDVKPVTTEDDEIDYVAPREGLITLCRKNDILAQWYPPTRGNPGVDVTKKVIPGILGREIALDLFEGANTKIDKDQLLAKIDGAVTVHGTQVRISKEITIHDHIGMNTGSIDVDPEVELTLNVTGDVQRGFNVTCHHLIVGGCIEDAEINVKRLKVEAGIVGNCEDPIRADFMEVGFVNGNRKIHGKHVRVQREISNGATVTGKVVTAHTIQGSTVYARDVAWTNYVNGQNMIVVGIDYSAKREYDKMGKQMHELKEPIEELQEASYANAKKMKQLRELSKVNPKHPLLTKELPKIKQLQEKFAKLKKIEDALKTRREQISEVMYSGSDAFLLVRQGFSKDASGGKVIPPDTVITIGHHTTKITDPGGGGIFSATEHGVGQSSRFNIKELKARLDLAVKQIIEPPQKQEQQAPDNAKDQEAPQSDEKAVSRETSA